MIILDGDDDAVVKREIIVLDDDDVNEGTGEPMRPQMVYVDEHTCIGCKHCAMIAQSMFFMEPDLGRARVFQQWGDDGWRNHRNCH